MKSQIYHDYPHCFLYVTWDIILMGISDMVDFPLDIPTSLDKYSDVGLVLETPAIGSEVHGFENLGGKTPKSSSCSLKFSSPMISYGELFPASNSDRQCGVTKIQQEYIHFQTKPFTFLQFF